MSEQLSIKLAEYGIDLEDAMARMDDNIDLYKSLALRYLSNESYIDFVAAMDVKDYDSAYKAIHTLKGVAGNLSFVDLYKTASIISEQLKQGEAQDVPQMIPLLEENHNKVMDGLIKWQDGDL
jgi:HPt (histidine-containing phosphotransfer) domain-containing protein